MPKTIPDQFPPRDRLHSMYEDIEYREYWNDPAQAQQDALEQRLVTRLLPDSGRRIVDLAGGYGRLAPCYLERFDQAVLCDGSLSLLRQARDVLDDRVVLVAADVSKLPFRPAAFDCVLAIRVFQHLGNLEDVIGETSRVLASRGRLVFSYHNKRNLHRVLRHATAQGADNPFSIEPANLWGTLVSRHPRQIAAFLAQARYTAPMYWGAVVVEPLAALTEGLLRLSPAGAQWARFMGRFELAPWLVGMSVTADDTPQPVIGSNDDIFACPQCHADLTSVDGGFQCPACNLTYPVVDGIFDFRPQQTLNRFGSLEDPMG
jgi:ubiquinone/menaquinone biosynthesis C-methylase UbiE